VKKSLLILPLVLLASALALSACGGGGSSSSSGGGDETAIEEAIETSAMGTDPSKCTEVQTEAFNEAETGESGAKALATCEKEVEEESAEPAESVTVSNISVDGESATADVAIEGSALSGQELELGLAKEEGDWKLNEFSGFAKYDAAGIASFLEEKLKEEEGVEPALATCVSEVVSEMSQEDAEAMIFEKNQEAFEEIVESCNE
jgi:ABC-type glycerol-3-phosphate transport system substrate-binding protein